MIQSFPRTSSKNLCGSLSAAAAAAAAVVVSHTDEAIVVVVLAVVLLELVVAPRKMVNANDVCLVELAAYTTDDEKIDADLVLDIIIVVV